MEEAHAHKHTHIHKAKEVTEKKMRTKLERQKRKEGKKNLRAEGMRTSFWTSEIVRHAERYRKRDVGVLRLLMQHMAYT